MEIQDLKDYVIENDLVPTILESLGCHHIKRHSDYYSCANPDGDNYSSVNVYVDSLSVINYTRDLDSVSKYHDIFTLVQFYNGIDFFDAVRYVCDCLGLSLYHNFSSNLPESIVLTRELLKMINDGESNEPDIPLSPISEDILSYYPRYLNAQFYNDNISYEVQSIFEIGYDTYSNRITIPIRNYDGSLVGIKGRWFGKIPDNSDIQKYIYIEPCSKGKILYGLDKTKIAIEKTRIAYVGESEKFVMQLWSYGDYNCVATGGKTISKQQIELLCRICDKVILCLDNDVDENELKNIADKFLGYVEVFFIENKNGLLVEHESPSDDPKKWSELKSCLRKIR